MQAEKIPITRGTFGRALLDEAGQYPCTGAEPSPHRGGAGDEQGAARQIDAQGALPGASNSRGRPEQGGAGPCDPGAPG